MKCAYVEWVDSVHMADWNDSGEVKPVRPEVSVGILVKDEPEFITLALSYAPETEQYGHLISIPKVAIKHFAAFNKKAKEKKRGLPTPEVGGL